MGTRIQSHQLKSGLYVSGRPDSHPKDKQPTMASRSVPYTGGDVKKSGELGKMFDLPKHHPTTTNSGSGSLRSGPNSGPFRKTPTSSSSSSSFSGPSPLQPTGLITSGPIRTSGPLDPSPQPDHHPPPPHKKPIYGPGVTNLAGEEPKVGFKVSRAVVWVAAVTVAMGLLVGAFLTVAVKKVVILVALVGVLGPIGLGIVWNCLLKRRGLVGYLQNYPDAELRGAIDGQFVKVTGVVTCGSIPLESSYQRVPRCVYVSTELFEYRGWGGKSAHPKQHFFSWGSRYSEKYVADFYISDFQSGLRALVKTGYGAKVAPFVRRVTVADVVKENQDLSPRFLSWLADRSLSSDNRIMRLKEGYIKEGSTMSVMGVVRRHDNVLMIVPPQEPVSTGYQWFRCLLPTYVEGLVLTCDDNQDADVIPV